MAIGAIFGRGLIEQYEFAIDFLQQSVAHRALHTGVSTCQRKLRALVVVEGGGNPVLDRVAIFAVGDVVLGSELARMGVRVAGLALLRRAFELDFVRAGLRLVAITARHAPVSPFQGELRFRMVKSGDVGP